MKIPHGVVSCGRIRSTCGHENVIFVGFHASAGAANASATMANTGATSFFTSSSVVVVSGSGAARFVQERVERLGRAHVLLLPRRGTRRVPRPPAVRAGAMYVCL